MLPADVGASLDGWADELAELIPALAGTAETTVMATPGVAHSMTAINMFARKRGGAIAAKGSRAVTLTCQRSAVWSVSSVH